jgi:hypothetical protein
VGAGQGLHLWLSCFHLQPLLGGPVVLWVHFSVGEGCLVGCKTGCMPVGEWHVILVFLRLSFSWTGSDLAVGVEVLSSFLRDAVLFHAAIGCCLLFLFLWIG